MLGWKLRTIRVLCAIVPVWSMMRVVDPAVYSDVPKSCTPECDEDLAAVVNTTITLDLFANSIS